MKHIFNLLFIILPLMLSCSQKQQGYTLDSTRTELKELIENRDSLTPGQVAKKERLVKLVMEKVTVEDGKVENLSRPEDFIEQDLSGFYHDILEESVVDLNHWIEVEQISNVDSLLSEAMRYYLLQQ